MVWIHAFFGLFVVLDVGWWYWAERRLRGLKWARLWRVLLAVFMVVQCAGALLRMGEPSPTRSNAAMFMPLSAMQYLWHLLVLPTTFLLTMLVRLGKWSARDVWKKREAKRPEPTAGLSRRQFLGAAAVAVPPLLASGLVPAALAQAGHFRIRSVRLAIPDLPPNLEGLRIAQVSDIHVGRFLPARMLGAIVEATNQLRADLVLLTGDLIDFSLADLPAALDAVKKMDAAHGLAMCVGNHDVIQNGMEFMRRVRASGVPLLSGQAATLRIRNEEVQLLALPWLRNDQSINEGMVQLLRRRREGAFPILMSHHPHALDPAAAAGLPLVLSGHTHGGQMMLSDNIGFGPLFYRYWSGLYRKGNSALFVSNGVGNWFPLRINAPAEIVDLTLTRG